MRPSAATVRHRVEDLCAAQIAERPLRERVLNVLRPVIDFSYYAWLLTDPETLVGTAPLARVPELGALPRVIRSKYLATTGRWTSLPANRCVVLSAMNDPPSGAGNIVWRDLLDGYGVTDLASLSLRDRYGSWSFLDLWRCGGSRPTFTAEEINLLDSVATSLTRGVRLALARSFAEPAGSEDVPGPGVLVLDDDLRPQQQTANADPQLRDLLPTAPGLSPVPAAVYNVAAQLLAVENGVDHRPAHARAQLGGTSWISITASRLAGTLRSGSSPIVVTLAPMPPHERVEIFARAAGLSPRERQLLHALVRGSDTSTIARDFRISELTVQDHLKSIFVKTNTGNRYDLITRSSGASP